MQTPRPSIRIVEPVIPERARTSNSASRRSSMYASPTSPRSPSGSVTPSRSGMAFPPFSDSPSATPPEQRQRLLDGPLLGPQPKGKVQRSYLAVVGTAAILAATPAAVLLATRLVLDPAGSELEGKIIATKGIVCLLGAAAGALGGASLGHVAARLAGLQRRHPNDVIADALPAELRAELGAARPFGS